MDGDLDEKAIEMFAQMDAEGDFTLPEGEVLKFSLMMKL
jgi:hypothetical protein